MASDYRSVPLSNIDSDNTKYAISTGAFGAELKNSINYVGLLNPPALLEQSGRFIIVAGFKRIAACRSLGWDSVTARCMAPETPSITCAISAIADNASQRALNVVELSRAVDLLTRLIDERVGDVGDASGVLEYFTRLGIGMNPSLLRKMQRIAGMDASLKDALADGSVALPVAMTLSTLGDAEAQDRLCQLLMDLNMSLNRQRELVDWIIAIARREKRLIVDLLSEETVKNIIDDNQSDRGLKTNIVRDYFKRRRFPEISAHEARYANAAKQLSLQKGIRLIPPQNFEGRKYSLQIEFENQHELKEINLALQRIVSSPDLIALLHVGTGV